MEKGLKERRSHARALLLLSSFLLVSCGAGVYLRTEVTRPEEVTGTYTLILYGARYSSDIENVALLVEEGGPYRFEVYAPDFDYKVEKNVPHRDALEKAEEFVRHHYAFMESQLSRIIGPSGNSIGYELRPLYYPIEFGSSDVLDIYYFFEGGKVVAKIRLKPEIEKALFGVESPFLFRMR